MFSFFLEPNSQTWGGGRGNTGRVPKRKNMGKIDAAHLAYFSVFPYDRFSVLIKDFEFMRISHETVFFHFPFVTITTM